MAKVYNTSINNLTQTDLSGVVSCSMEGDSLTSQNTTSTTVYNSMGYMNALNAISGHRFPYLISNNFGVGGGTLATMDTDKTSFASMAGQIMFLRAGTNDVAGGSTLLSMQTAFTSLKTYIITTLGKTLHFTTITPRTQDAGVPLTAGMLVILKAFNAWVLAQDNGTTLIVSDPYEAMCTAGTDDPNPNYFKNETGKYLHDNPEGALVVARIIWQRLQECGYAALPEPDPVVDNKLPVGAMAGTGGTLTSPATGVAPTGINVSGSGGSQPRTASVSSDGIRVVFSPISGDGSSANFKVKNITDVTAGFTTGDSVYAWAIISVHTVSRCDGPWIQATEKAGTNVVYYGYNKAGANTGFMPSDQERLVIHTPAWPIRTLLTGITLEVVCQVDAASNAGTADITIHAMGIRNVTTDGDIVPGVGGEYIIDATTDADIGDATRHRISIEPSSSDSTGTYSLYVKPFGLTDYQPLKVSDPLYRTYGRPVANATTMVFDGDIDAIKVVPEDVVGGYNLSVTGWD